MENIPLFENSRKRLRALIIVLLILLPTNIYAHGEQIFSLSISSILYLFFGGLIIGLLESRIIISFSDTVIGLGRIIGINYLVLILTYIFYSGLIWINTSFFYSSIVVRSISDFDHLEHQATIKCIISIILYFLILIGLKYWIYKNRIFVDDDNENYYVLMIIPNIIVLGLLFAINFRALVWLFAV
jgi:hypothetical protein